MARYFKHLDMLVAGFLTGAAAAVFVSVLIGAVWYAPEADMATSTGPMVSAQNIPARLIIPSLGIDARVQDVGLTRAGNMGTPNNFTDVVWYEYGMAPGQKGSAVIDGHVDNGLGLAGVFKHLSQITPGADVEVVTAGGSTLHFTVVSVHAYPYTSVPIKALFEPADAVRLNLVTCEGVWVPSGRTYDHRLVVFTRLE